MAIQCLNPLISIRCKGTGNDPKPLTDGLCHGVTKECFDLGDKENSCRVLVNTRLAWPHFGGDWSCLRTVNPNEVLANTIMRRQHHLKGQVQAGRHVCSGHNKYASVAAVIYTLYYSSVTGVYIFIPVGYVQYMHFIQVLTFLKISIRNQEITLPFLLS